MGPIRPCASCGALGAYTIRDAISDSFTIVRNASKAWPFGGTTLCSACVWACKALALRCAMWFARVDDADFPGELNYILWFQREWNLALTIIQPNESAVEWLRARRDKFNGVTELHSRSSEFVRTFFYEVIEEATQAFGCVFMGMRGEESGKRRALFDRRGSVYQVASHQWRANPLANWRGIDVYVYAETHGIELLHVYRCIGFIHAQRPTNWQEVDFSGACWNEKDPKPPMPANWSGRNEW